MIPTSTASIWVSRLRTADFDDEMGFNASAANELPHVNALPVHLRLPPDSLAIREWPNLAGRLEPAEPGDIVRWCRSLAPEPPHGSVMARGESVEVRLLAEMRLWLMKFARALTQMPGVSLATPSDTPRIIVLTPGGIAPDVDLPRGLERTPTRLGEFPGGVVLTMDRRSFEHRAEYADAVEAIVREA